MQRRNAAMGRLACIAIYFSLVANAFADSCTIEASDLNDALQSTGQGPVLSAPNLRDPYSDEPVNRYVQLLPEGVTVIVEQKNCLMYNLSVTLLIPEGISLEKMPDVLAATLTKTGIWKKWFAKLDAVKILQDEFASARFTSQAAQPGSFSYPFDDKIKAADENSETLLNVVRLDSGPLPFNVIVSLYIGVGGL